jgi:hypothetical protein
MIRHTHLPRDSTRWRINDTSLRGSRLKYTDLLPILGRLSVGLKPSGEVASAIEPSCSVSAPLGFTQQQFGRRRSIRCRATR